MRLRVGVVGAGPAGTACATALAKNGHSVTIFEKLRSPRDKACGDALIPDAIRCLRHLDIFARVEPHLFKLSRLKTFSPAGISVDIEGEIYTCRRYCFDAQLLDIALDHGAELIIKEVISLEHAADNMRIRCADGYEEHFDFVIGATGASNKSLGIYGTRYRKHPSAYAMRQYVEVAEPHGLDAIHVFYSREVLPGYAWIFPVGPKEVNIGAGVLRSDRPKDIANLRRTYEMFAASNALCNSLLSSSTYRGDLRGAPMRTGLHGSDCSRGRLLLCGEAIGATYAMTGEGIGKAMETGIIAADTLTAFSREFHTGSISTLGIRYAEALDASMRHKFASYDRAQKWMSYPWAVDLLARKANKSENARRVLSGILAETADPTELLSFRGLASLAFGMMR